MPRSRSIQPKKNTTWDIQITAVRKEFDETSRRLLVSAAIEMAIDKMEDIANAKLAKLKGDQSRQARAQRKELKAELAALEGYRRRMGLPRLPADAQVG